MIITKEIEVSWNPNNQDHFINLGYKYFWRGKFTVPIESLPPNSQYNILIQCDYCGKHFYRKFRDHQFIINRDKFINKDCCKDCVNLKTKEILVYKQENNLLDENTDGYWTFKENRLKELDLYIKKYGNADNLYISKEGNKIWFNFRNNNHYIPDAIEELGYNLDEIMKYKPIGYYDDIKNVISRIEIFINKYGKFPTMEEIKKDLSISQRHITKHGGIYKIKKLMNYNDENDLIDDNGFYNLSAYEYMVAQWLIHNGISYKREQYPFPKSEGLYRSDFMFITNNNEIVHCEVWGYSNKDSTPDGINYNDVKNRKLELYKKYNLKVISIDKDLLISNRIDIIQEKLYDIFKTFFDIGFKYIENKTILPSRNLSDIELLDIIMKYSKNKEFLPEIKALKINGMYRYYEEIIKRYNSYNNFAIKFEKKTNKKYNYWNKNSIFEVFNILNKNNLPIKYETLNELGYNNIPGIILSINLKLLDLKLEFYNSLIDSKIPKDDIVFLENIINNKGTNIKNKVTSEQQLLAQQILNNIPLSH